MRKKGKQSQAACLAGRTHTRCTHLNNVAHRAGDECSPCAAEVRCPGGIEPTVSVPGYWISNRETTSGSTGGPGSAVVALKCSPVDACVEGNRCAFGYQGELVRGLCAAAFVCHALFPARGLCLRVRARVGMG
jgi:hypothetical protein